jgi:hypothetical protein
MRAECGRQRQQDPFPIALVRRDEHHRRPRRKRCAKPLDIFENHAIEELFALDLRGLDDLDHHIAIAAVVIARERLQAGVIELREGTRQVLADDLGAVRDDMGREEREDTAEPVQRRQRQRGERAHPPRRAQAPGGRIDGRCSAAAGFRRTDVHAPAIVRAGRGTLKHRSRRGRRAIPSPCTITA